MTMNETFDLTQFDAVEVHGCVQRHLRDDGTFEVEVADAGERPDFWTVYLHLRSGGIIAYKDFPTESEANLSAKELERDLTGTHAAQGTGVEVILMNQMDEKPYTEVFVEDIEEGNEVLIGRHWELIDAVAESKLPGMIWLHYADGTASQCYPARALLKLAR
jgi:hypothetical protein